jgi:hypothetical protein
MRKIEPEFDDWLRPDYKRSDFGRMVRGAVTQVEFAELTRVLLACVGEDEGLRFQHHSQGNCKANHNSGDWTYEIDNSNQITLRYWLDSVKSISQELSNPPCVTTQAETDELQRVLTSGVRDLQSKILQGE